VFVPNENQAKRNLKLLEKTRSDLNIVLQKKYTT